MGAGLFGVEERIIFDKAGLEARQRLLESRGLSVPGNEDRILGLYQGDSLVATGSLVGDIIQAVAVDRDFEGSGAAATLISSLIRAALDLGRQHLFLYTTSGEAPRFADLGFACVAQTREVALFEWGQGSIETWLASATVPGTTRVQDRTGAIVVNCNPFTLGHRALIEFASARVDRLYVFVVEADRSLFPFQARLRLVREGTQDLPGVQVLEGGPYIISSATFPTYFIKRRPGSDPAADTADLAVRMHARLDLTIFRERIAPAFGIQTRFAGTEPYCTTTSAYNLLMQEILPSPTGQGRPIEVIEMPRLEVAGSAVSASTVRTLIKEGKLSQVESLVPPTTYRWLCSPEAIPILERIRASDSRH